MDISNVWLCCVVLFYKMSGGRPMNYTGRSFTDIVSGKEVRTYRDWFGRLWMADGGRWSLFRAEAEQPNRPTELKSRPLP